MPSAGTFSTYLGEAARWKPVAATRVGVGLPAGADAQNPRVSLRPIAISGSSTETTLVIRFDRRANTGTQLFGSRSRYEVAGPVALPLALSPGARVACRGYAQRKEPRRA